MVTDVATWHGRAPIALEVAEGPHAWEAFRAAREGIKACATRQGVDPEALTWRVEYPARVQGKVLSTGTCPITGNPIPSPYFLTATHTIQEN